MGPQLNDLIFTEDMSPSERDMMLRHGSSEHTAMQQAGMAGAIAPILALQRPTRPAGTENLPDTDPSIRAWKALDYGSKLSSVLPGGTAGALNALRLLIR